jgi:hypothetical protein
MKNERIRIASDQFVNESQLNKIVGLDVLFAGSHDFVYIPHYFPWLLSSNGTWMGALGHLMNDNQMD